MTNAPHTVTEVTLDASHATDTIAAISTPPGEGAIGIIRLSGPAAITLACRLFQRADGRMLRQPQAFRQYYGHVVDPQTGEALDEVLLSVMHAPRSYTREEMAEISGHGGPAPLRAILARLLSAGARLAAPGEFTLRAFLNGRIDLTQAEAVLDTIRARTDAGLRAAQERLSGALGQRIGGLRARLVALLASLEAAIDFAEDDLTFLTSAEIGAELQAVHEAVCALIASYTRGKLLREGAATAIVGRPNTGKSSLLNALLGEARAIVTEVPGTTRDTIEEQIEIAGVPLRLLDTAGICRTEDIVERLGVERSHAALARADLVLLVLDGAQLLTPDDLTLFELARDARTIVVLNKADLPGRVTTEEVQAHLSAPVISLSAKTGAGMAVLETTLCEMLGGATLTEHTLLATLRQREAAERAAEALALALATLAGGGTEELLVVDILAAAGALGEITGEDIRASVIHDLFARFCVGK